MNAKGILPAMQQMLPLLSYPWGIFYPGVPPSLRCGQTHTCENSTFPILRMRVVKMTILCVTSNDHHSPEQI